MSDKYVKCGECMKDAPYKWCCKDECGERELCKDCTSPARGDHCPNNDLYFSADEDGEQL